MAKQHICPLCIKDYHNLFSFVPRQISILANKNSAQQDFTMPSAMSASHCFSTLFPLHLDKVKFKMTPVISESTCIKNLSNRRTTSYALY